MHKAEKTCSIPALRNEDGTWSKTAAEKCELLANSFATKWTLPDGRRNHYFDSFLPPALSMSGFFTLRSNRARTILMHSTSLLRQVQTE